MNDEMERQIRRRMKVELRRRQRTIRGVLPADARVESAEKACERALALPCFETAGPGVVVAVYAAIRAELDPAPLADALRARGITVVYPRVDAVAHALDFCEALPSSLRPSAYGVPEPHEDADALSNIDIVIVPGLAIDGRGYRVGYGGGYYDATLPRFPNAHRVGFVYDFQLIVEAPNEPHDIPVTWVVTDKRTLDCRHG